MNEDLEKPYGWYEDNETVHAVFHEMRGIPINSVRQIKHKPVKMCARCHKFPAKVRYCRDCSYDVSIENHHRAELKRLGKRRKNG